MNIEYDSFDLVVEQLGERYCARVVDSPAGQASIEFSFPFSDLQVENFLLRLGRSKGLARRVLSTQLAAAKDFGGALFEAVFAGEVRSSFRTSADQADRRGVGLRVRLRLVNAPQLAELPWEYLYDGVRDRFLGLSAKTPIVRYLDRPGRIQPLQIEPPLEVLTLIASPTGFPLLDVEREYRNLRGAMDILVERGLVVLDRLAEPTLACLQHRLRQRACNIFHFIGHGSFDQNSQDGVLLFEDENHRSQDVSSVYLGALLHDHRFLRLAVLNACEGARGLGSDPFSGMAQGLVQQGIPAVIAMQFDISDDAAIIFSKEFYEAIAAGYPVDAALAESRKAIFASPNDLEWGTPVLFMRAPNGLIFDMQAIGGGGLWRPETVDGQSMGKTVQTALTNSKLASLSVPSSASVAIIVLPVDRSEVLQRTAVSGRTDSLDPDLQPWLIVETANGVLYPQTPVTRRLGAWSYDVRIGRAQHGLDVGTEFVIMLVAVGAETNFQFERYIRGQHESSDSIGSAWPRDMIVLDKRRVSRGPY